MNKVKKILLSSTLLLLIFCFTFSSLETFEFSYPNREHTNITISTDKFKKFDKEWQGADYHYDSKSKEGITCSILYYKLNKKEQQLFVDPHGATVNSEIAFKYFSANSPMKKHEEHIHHWGNKEDDFMFRQANIYQIEEKRMNQKDMYGYAMCDKDLFINVHLYKNNYTAADSTTMRAILKTLMKKKISD